MSKEVFIRSYNDYAHTFETKTGTVEIPSKWRKPKNIATITQEQYDELKGQEVFGALLNSKNGGFKKLDAMPRDALDSLEKLAIAQDETEKYKREALNATLAADKAREEIERLKTQIESDGGTDEVLNAAKEEAATAKAELEELRAQLAEMRANVVHPTPEGIVAAEPGDVPENAGPAKK